jgi:hypothetical protein
MALDDLLGPYDLRELRKGRLRLPVQARWYDLPSMRSNHTSQASFLHNIPIYAGINKVEANLKDQLVFIEGTAPPSSIVAAIQNTGRDAILRGSGTTNSTHWVVLLLASMLHLLIVGFSHQAPLSVSSRRTPPPSPIRFVAWPVWSRSPPI